MDSLSVSSLNPDAPPFQSVSLVLAQYMSPPPVDFLPAQCLYPPPSPPSSAYAGLAYCFCWCGARFASKGCTCAQVVGVGVPAFPHPAWLHPPLPLMRQYCCPPPPLPIPPRPANCCPIEESGVEGSDEAALAEAGGEPSPRSVLPSRPPPTRRAGLPPPPAAWPPRPPALGGKGRRGWRLPRLPFDPTADATSLMIRNIPNKFMKGWFVGMLDQHCAEENAKVQSGGGDGGRVKSEYDFFYLPIDFGTQYNKGYAFVNMTTAAGARRLRAFLQGHSWAAAGSSKVCDVVPARLGGLDVLVAHFSKSRFPCSNEEFLPVRFEPPRDGVRQTAGRVVGRLASRR